jgi:hypothetical protein
MVSRASAEVFTLLFFTGKRVEEEGMVIAVKSTGFRVMVPRYGIEGVVRLVSKDQESGRVANPWTYDAVDGVSIRATIPATSVPSEFKNLLATSSSKSSSSSSPTLTAEYKVFQRVRVVIFVEENKVRVVLAARWFPSFLFVPFCDLRFPFCSARGWGGETWKRSPLVTTHAFECVCHQHTCACRCDASGW